MTVKAQLDTDLRCASCGRESKTNFASSLRDGWECCCGQTMRLVRTDADVSAATRSVFAAGDEAVRARLAELDPNAGLNFEQRRLADAMRGLGLSERVIKASISWVRGGELNRWYGPGLIIGYSVQAAIRSGVLAETEEAKP